MDRAVPHRPGNTGAYRDTLDYHRCIDHRQTLWRRQMRKPRDFDAELKALDDKAKELKARKVQQLGELVIATGADSLSPELAR